MSKRRKTRSSTEDTTKSLWENLQKIQQEELDSIARERKALEEEKKKMHSFEVDDSDIVEINVGGELIIQAHRGTLCQVEGPMFSGIFSGRWEDSVRRDKEERIFLDHDPELLRIIINFMRLKSIGDPSEPLMPPTVPREKQQAFRCLTKYFGLESLFSTPVPAFLSDFRVHEPNGSHVTTAETGGGRQLTYDGRSNHFLCLDTPAADGDCWKITVEPLSSGGWLYLGVTGNKDATGSSYSDPQSSGWGSSGEVLSRGADHSGQGDWTGFQQGDILYFRQNQGTLFLFVRNQHHSMNCGSTSPLYVHFNFLRTGTKVSIESLHNTEKDSAGWV